MLDYTISMDGLSGRYKDFLERRYGPGDKKLTAACTQDSAVILKMGRTTGQVLTLENALEIVKKGVFSVWFPAQKSISSWMGDVRVRRNGTALISNQQIKDMISSLRPGDILLERREWYLSNLTEKILDRTMTIPNGIARQFDEEYGKAGQQMDLIVFLDGYERSGKALDAGLEAFRTT
jgi:hypothetical protein